MSWWSSCRGLDNRVRLAQTRLGIANVRIPTGRVSALLFFLLLLLADVELDIRRIPSALLVLLLLLPLLLLLLLLLNFSWNKDSRLPLNLDLVRDKDNPPRILNHGPEDWQGGADGRQTDLDNGQPGRRRTVPRQILRLQSWCE